MESLYTKYRPQTFDDVVGQQHVVSTLKNAITEQRIGHAYLFCGPRGTGKTTMARLLAKALECDCGDGQLPDGTCEQCRLIAAGEHPDVLELDAASRTGVDNVRDEIISRVGYAAVMGRRKVYIIDEVHMLTTAAFNALLKTLEEPPEHVYFVMCTTDPQKIPATILSRVQRFDFHAIATQDLKARLEYVCASEGFSYDDEAIDLIARHARGGLRDALSTLEQLSTFGNGSITAEVAQDFLGETSGTALASVSDAIARRDVPALFEEVASLVDAGRDLLQFCRELAAHLRDVYVVAAVGARPGVVAAGSDELDHLGEEAHTFGSVDRISRALAVLADASREMRLATNQRLVLEVALTRLARPASDLTLDALADRVSELERQVAALAAVDAGSRAREAERDVPARENGPMGTSQAPSARQNARASAVRAAPPQTVAPQSASPQTAAQQPAPRRPAASQPATPQMTPQQPAAPQPVKARVSTSVGRAADTAPKVAGKKPVPIETSSASGLSQRATSGVAKDAGELQRRWKQVVDGLLASNPSRGSLLLNASLAEDDGNTLTISLPAGSGFALRMLERKDVAGVILPAVQSVFGPRQVQYVEGSKGASAVTPAVSAARSAGSKPAALGSAPAPQSAPATSRTTSVTPTQAATSRPVGIAPIPSVADQLASSSTVPARTAGAVASQGKQSVSAPSAPDRSAPQAPAAPSTPEQSSAPSPVVPASSVAKPAIADFPMPWDAAPEYEEVPYDDETAVSYDEDDINGDGDQVPDSVRSDATPAPVPAADTQAATSFATRPSAPDKDASKQDQAPAAPPSAMKKAADSGLPDNADQIMSMLRDVFGDGVTMSVEHGRGSGDSQDD